MHSTTTTTDVLRYRIRSDIVWTEIHGSKRSWWIATDPLRSQHFRCSPEERELIRLLEKSPTVADWKKNFLVKFPYQSISHSDLERLLQRFVEYGLLRATSDSHSSINNCISNSQFVKPSVATCILTTLHHIEQIPWRLIQSRWSLGNPERFLKSIAGCFGWLYGAKAVAAWIVFAAIVAIAVLNRLLSDVDPLAWDPSKWMASVALNQIGNCVVVLMVTRLLHEMGHAVVATRLGVHVRNVGVFWMLGIACPYVDVSDAWRLQSRNQRISVSLAGIYTEIVIASIAGAIWLNTVPCLLHSLCWQTMVICSVMTVTVNMNPLVRYDGYFALSDYLEVANLRDDSVVALRKLFLTSPITSNLSSNSLLKQRPCLKPSEVGLGILGLASSVYRMMIVVTFAAAAIAIGRAWELDAIGLAMAIFLLISSFLLPSIRFLIRTCNEQMIMTFRVAFGITLVVVLLGYAIWIPLPSIVTCNGIVGWSNQRIKYLSEDAMLISTNPVQFDNALLRIQNETSSEQVTQIHSKIHQARLAMYRDTSSAYPIEGLTLQAILAKENQQRLENQLASIQHPTDMSSSGANSEPLEAQTTRWHPMELPSPEEIDPVLESGFGEPSRREPGYSIQEDLNAGRWVAAGTPIAVWIQGDRVTVTATVDEETMSQIQIGTPARVILAPYPTIVETGRVTSVSDIASLEIGQASSRPKSPLSSLAKGMKEPGESDKSQSFGVVIEITSPMDGPASAFPSIDKRLFGANASVVLVTKPKSIYDRICNYLQHVVRY